MNIPDPNWSERDERNAENAPLGWPPGLPAKIELIGRMMMGAIKRFWNKANPVYPTTGALDAYVVTTEGQTTVLNLYEIIRVRIDRANTTTVPTLKFAKTNARTIVKITGAGVVPLIAGDMQAGRDHSFWFNGTNFVLSNPATIDSSVISGLGAGVATWLGAPTSANLAAAVTDETGSGALVFANTPTLVTPVLGAATGASLNLSGLTASSAVATDASKNLVSVTNTGTGNNVLATSPALVTPALGTPSAAVLTNATGLPIGTGVAGLGTGVATALAIAANATGGIATTLGASAAYTPTVTFTGGTTPSASAVSGAFQLHGKLLFFRVKATIAFAGAPSTVTFTLPPAMTAIAAQYQEIVGVNSVTGLALRGQVSLGGATTVDVTGLSPPTSPVSTTGDVIQVSGVIEVQ